MLEVRNSDVKTILENSQNLTDLDVEEIMFYWKRNKNTLIKDILDGELIKEFPIEVPFEPNQIELENVANTLKECLYDNNKAQEFIQRNTMGFKENKVVDPNGYDVPKGAKLSKAFKHLSDDKYIVRLMQDKLSEYVQKTKITGTLCLSAHPLDYLTASDNSSNWSSCHSLIHSNRAGNISYMCDASTLICYIKSDEPTDIYGVKWNNKKWRMFLHFSDKRNGVFAGKQYPMNLDGILETIKKEFLPWRFHNDIWKHENLQKDNQFPRYYLFHNMWVSDRVMIQQHPQGLNYNDLLYNTFPFGCPEYIFSLYMEDSERFQIGHPFYCLKCGEKMVLEEDCVLCPDCEVKYGFEAKTNFGNCCICGKRVYLGNDNDYFIDWRGNIYCDICGDDNLEYCENCYDWYVRDEMIITEEEKSCKWCWEAKYGS